MLQFYFLSILLNAVTAFVLMYGDIEDQAGESRLPRIVLDETFRLVLGILTAVTGFFKLLTAIRGDIPVIGDLVPAAADSRAVSRSCTNSIAPGPSWMSLRFRPFSLRSCPLSDTWPLPV
jgi:hypothetical protein